MKSHILSEGVNDGARDGDDYTQLMDEYRLEA
jgi:hypothetical protein